ncbi:MAG: YjgP/YjgQ family permease [Bacteroidetes bacterium]|nr:MAG: YjgP/YjgQ family permease [Bacteroidota bacterium]
MKRLYVFSIRSFVGPFLVTLAISMFMLVMQFFWKYLDDLMGKGLSTWVILELLFYISASLIPLALPLAILLSSIMTFGNLAENNELTALKSSGLSLYRIMKPLMVVVLLIALGTFYFANYVIPVSNLKWHSLIYDIQNTKISSIITPGVYSNELDGYAIKVDEGTESSFKGILIHDHTSPDEIKTIRADEGTIYKSENGKFLYFELKNGYIAEELEPQSPNFLPNGEIHPSKHNNRPSRRSTFSQATYKIDLSGFSLSRSQEDLFKDKHEMLNVFQISEEIDSVKRNADNIQKNFLVAMKADHPYFESLNFKPVEGVDEPNLRPRNESAIYFDSLKDQDKLLAVQNAQSWIRRKNQNLKGQEDYLEGINNDLDGYWIEFHRKFALTYAIIVLFFIGAPLGAIVRKGGFGAPVVIAALLFMIYFVLISVGDSLANSGVVSPFLGMWFASIVLTPIAFVLLRAAANDSPVFNKETWSKIFSFKFKKA